MCLLFFLIGNLILIFDTNQFELVSETDTSDLLNMKNDFLHNYNHTKFTVIRTWVSQFIFYLERIIKYDN